MKKFCISFVIISIIILTCIAATGEKPATHTEYLRIHIRADSNAEAAQSVKYQVKDEVVAFLTPYIAECTTKADADETLARLLSEIERVADSVLLKNGFDYNSKAKLNTEEFPTRVYNDMTLEQGYYDALIIELGSGKGDNWWCVVYPPLCFTGTGTGEIVYRSKILEIIENFRNKQKEE